MRDTFKKMQRRRDTSPYVVSFWGLNNAKDFSWKSVLLCGKTSFFFLIKINILVLYSSLHGDLHKKWRAWFCLLQLVWIVFFMQVVPHKLVQDSQIWVNCHVVAAPELMALFLQFVLPVWRHRLHWNDHCRVIYAHIHMADLVDLILLFLIYLNFARE